MNVVKTDLNGRRAKNPVLARPAPGVVPVAAFVVAPLVPLLMAPVAGTPARPAELTSSFSFFFALPAMVARKKQRNKNASHCQ